MSRPVSRSSQLGAITLPPLATKMVDAQLLRSAYRFGVDAPLVTLAGMRRFFLLLLLWILPIQFALAATIEAREYSRGGHSEFTHAHAASANDISANRETDSDTDVSARSHAECGVCHCHHSLAYLGQSQHNASPAAARDVPSADHSDSPSDFTGLRPDRPQWFLLA